MTNSKTVAKLPVAMLCLAISALAHADAILTTGGNFTPPNSSLFSYTDITAYTEVMNPSLTNSLTSFPADPASVSYEAQAAAAVNSGLWTGADANLLPSWVPIYPFYLPNDGTDLAPEPSTLVLTALGLLGLAVVGNRRKDLARSKT